MIQKPRTGDMAHPIKWLLYKQEDSQKPQKIATCNGMLPKKWEAETGGLLGSVGQLT